MQDTLEQLLAKLKAEIEDAEHGDVDRAELARLAKAVEAKLAGDDGHDDEGLADDLQRGVVRWESDHPQLAGLLQRAIDTLGGIGL